MLTEKQKKRVEESVKLTIEKYGDALLKLSKT